jgi:hypothetical protein
MSDKPYADRDRIRVMLSEKDFHTLIRGGIVQYENIAISLKHIGYDVMHMLIEEAEGYR